MSVLFEKHKEKFCIIFILLLAFIIYVLNLTDSPLWYDEAIEYWYSKVLIGEVPGGFGTANMYERICYTYQPPLYNVLIYIWLLFFDSEISFRLIGVIFTLIGGVGIYQGLKKVSNYKWASIGCLMYFFTLTVAYYALECAEYNLMLCCIAWALCFYIYSIVDEKTSSLIGFFVFACLSVYSQYGAALLMVMLYILLLMHFWKKKKKQKELAVMSLLTVLVAIVLGMFFLIPQLIHQGTVTVSHSPHFANGGILKDFVISILTHAEWTFCSSNNLGTLWLFLVKAVVGVLGISTVLALLKKDSILNKLVVVVIGSWIIYYFATAFSFYGHNHWSGNMGTENIGNRYGLFLAPLWIFVLIYGTYQFSSYLKLQKQQRFYQGYRILIVTAIFVYVAVGTMAISNPIAKDDVRNAVKAWYEEEAYQSVTLVHNWSEPNFQFYVCHNKEYDNSYQSNILATTSWIKEEDQGELDNQLNSIGMWELESFYYIAPASEYCEIFIELADLRGYTAERVYNGGTALLYFERKSV